MSDGRTYWWGKDAAWWRRERIVELGEEFGPAGPAVIDWLSCEAKAQNDAGRVKAGVRSTARGVFVDAETVRHVLSRASQTGLLDDYLEADGRFTCRISGWQNDQRASRAAARQAALRSQKADAEGATEGDVSRPVTPSGQIGQDRSKPPHEPPQGGNLLPDPPPEHGRKRDRDRYVSAVRHFAIAVYEDDSPDLLTAIDQAARYVKARTPDEVSRFLRQHWPQLEVVA